jgi:isopentenyl phosphate kinase
MLNMTRLNSPANEAHLANGLTLNAIFTPCLFYERQIHLLGAIKTIGFVLQAGFVPVTFGGVVVGSSIGFSILSGD